MFELQKPEAGQIWVLREPMKHVYSLDTLSIQYVGDDYFVCKEDPVSSYTFQLLKDKYKLLNK